jgi:hypothetical protein
MTRYSTNDIATWRSDGCVKIENFFTPDEVAEVVKDFEVVFGRTQGGEEGCVMKPLTGNDEFNNAQFKDMDSVPMACSPALNLIGLHPALMDFAKQALGVDRVHLYQCQAWAKFTGDTDYGQPFHCDYGNHTLTVPSDDQLHNSITIICYFSDVSEEHGPMHYVTRTDSREVADPKDLFADFGGAQDRLKPLSRSTAGPAGTIFPYSIDVWHRATNMTAPGGRRFAVMACFRAADNDSIGYTAWPYSFQKPWATIFDNATPEQLACFGVHLPGHPFWTEKTLARAQARYPGWDLTPYREAMAA